jgi:hypothetical protein
LYILVGILLLAAGLRFAYLTETPPGVHQDEASVGWNAWCLLNTGTDQAGVRWPLFYYRALGENRASLFMYYLMPFQAVAGFSIWSMRFASAVGGVAGVLLIYVVGSRLLGRTAGLMAAGLMAVDSWSVQHSRWAHDAAICPLLVLLPFAVLLWANMPLDSARDKPLDSARDKPLDSARDKPLDSARDKPLDSARDRPFDRARGAPEVKPGDDAKRRRPRPLLAALGGGLAGIACYGYPSVPQFLPLFLFLAILLTWRGWWETVKTRRGALAIGAMVVAGAVTFGPLAWKHLTDPNISKRGRELYVYKETDSSSTKIEKVLQRYPAHFGLDFLFLKGDTVEHYCPPGYGEFRWYMLPLMLLGLVALALKLRSSRGERIVLLWVVLYPVGDLISRHATPHCLRSFPGVPGLILLAAAGATWAGNWLWRRKRDLAWPAFAAFALAAVALNLSFYANFFGDYSRKVVYRNFHTDLVEACRWIKPRLNETDAVFYTTSIKDTYLPYIVTVVALEYDPKQWFRDVRDINRHQVDASRDVMWDYYFRVGKLYFMYGLTWVYDVQQLQQNGRPDRVYFVMYPDEVVRLRRILQQLEQIREYQDDRQKQEYQGIQRALEQVVPQLEQPVHVITGPEGPSMVICQATL